APFRSVMVTGPFLSEPARYRLAERLGRLGQPVAVRSFVTDMEELLRRATGVVSMAGYNTVMEEISARVPALLVPRESPRREQAIRAERLASRADLEPCPAGPATPARIDRFVRRVLTEGRAREPSLRLDGLEVAASAIGELLFRGAHARRAG
ncbi:MAG: glycosyltransferase, partial [Acidimicrobiia bacterium]